jgi:hypothetical protein
LFGAWLVAISSKCRFCWARSRGNSCLIAPMLLNDYVLEQLLLHRIQGLSAQLLAGDAF